MKPHLLVLTLLVIVVGLPAASAEPDWANHPVNVWVKQSPRDNAAAPRFGWEGSGSWDPIHRKWIHHGGHDGIPQGFHLFTFDLDTGRWEQKFPPTSPAGVCCSDGANVFDPVNRRFVRFPGGSLGHGYQWSRGVKLRNSAVWLYDLASNSWMNMRPAPYSVFNPRDALGSLDAGAAFDPVHELAISFGGQTSSGETNNLFVYDAYANRLTRLQPGNPPPPRRLTDQPIAAATFRDTVELLNKGAGDGEYRYHIHAYIVRAVNRIGTESGPSPYTLTIPSEPVNVLNREGAGGIAERKWDANPEKKIAGYRVYKLQGTWEIVRLTDEPIRQTRFTHKGGSGATRYWITAVDVRGQEGVPSSPVWHNRSYGGFFVGEWHQ